MPEPHPITRVGSINNVVPRPGPDAQFQHVQAQRHTEGDQRYASELSCNRLRPVEQHPRLDRDRPHTPSTAWGYVALRRKQGWIIAVRQLRCAVLECRTWARPARRPRDRSVAARH
jgi:hypothetical protein